MVARRLGASASLIGCVGRDLAEQALSGPRADGVELRCAVTATAPTGVSAITVDDDGGKTIVLAGGANDAWPREHADEGRATSRRSARPTA